MNAIAVIAANIVALVAYAYVYYITWKLGRHVHTSTPQLTADGIADVHRPVEVRGTAGDGSKGILAALPVLQDEIAPPL